MEAFASELFAFDAESYSKFCESRHLEAYVPAAAPRDGILARARRSVATGLATGASTPRLADKEEELAKPEDSDPPPANTSCVEGAMAGGRATNLGRNGRDSLEFRICPVSYIDV